MALARPCLHSRNRRALIPGSQIKQSRDLDPNTYIAPSKQWYKVIHWSIHNPGYYLQWLLYHCREACGQPEGLDDRKLDHGQAQAHFD
ncbi:hypothetical protein PAMP_000891 [Pampus punctatissimus]